MSGASVEGDALDVQQDGLDLTIAHPTALFGRVATVVVFDSFSLDIARCDGVASCAVDATLSDQVLVAWE